MRDFRLYELPDSTFEELVGVVCRCELGTGVVTFASGKDGGRDGRFVGTAQRYPSETNQWTGKFIIQSKHCQSPIGSCADPDFLENKSSVISKEIPRIKGLILAGELENYLMFTNRKLTGGADANIRARITSECGIENVGLVGVEILSRMISLNFRDVVTIVPQLQSALGPLRFHSQDLARVISAIQNSGVQGMQSDPAPVYISLDEKNELNKLSQRYFQWLQAESAPYFEQIQAFLRDPRNKTYTAKYLNIVTDFNHRIIVNRDQFESFDRVFSTIYDSVLEHEPDLRNNSRLVLTVLHYMYWACDLGEKVRASTNSAS
jgi:hypothetical protein